MAERRLMNGLARGNWIESSKGSLPLAVSYDCLNATLVCNWDIGFSMTPVHETLGMKRGFSALEETETTTD